MSASRKREHFKAVEAWAPRVGNDRKDADAGDHGGRQARANLCHVYEITLRIRRHEWDIGGTNHMIEP
jgi:hypothetical protein